MVATAVGLIHSAKDSRIVIKAKHFLFILLTLPRHSVRHCHLVLGPPYCLLSFAIEDPLAKLVTIVTILIFFILILVNG